MKSTLTISILLCTLQVLMCAYSFAQFAPTVHQAMSYANLISSKDYQEDFKVKLGEACYKKILKVYKSGNDLHCDALTKHAIAIGDFATAVNDSDDRNHLTYYHHTKVKEVTDIIGSVGSSEERTNHLFENLRHLEGPKQILFVASDFKSSESYGERTIKFTMRKDAKVLTKQILQEQQENCVQEIKQRILAKKIKVNLEDCIDINWNKNSITWTAFYALLEDSGIALFDYYGEAETILPWFQLIGPEWVQNVEVVEK